MNIWQLQEAKAKLSELVKLCKSEPHIISVRGKDEVVMISLQEYKKIIQPKLSFTELMATFPSGNHEIDLDREVSKFRKVEL